MLASLSRDIPFLTVLQEGFFARLATTCKSWSPIPTNYEDQNIGYKVLASPLKTIPIITVLCAWLLVFKPVNGRVTQLFYGRQEIPGAHPR